MGKWTIIDTSTNQEIGGVTENEDSCSVDINESTMCGKTYKIQYTDSNGCSGSTTYTIEANCDFGKSRDCPQVFTDNLGKYVAVRAGSEECMDILYEGNCNNLVTARTAGLDYSFSVNAIKGLISDGCKVILEIYQCDGNLIQGVSVPNYYEATVGGPAITVSGSRTMPYVTCSKVYEYSTFKGDFIPDFEVPELPIN